MDNCDSLDKKTLPLDKLLTNCCLPHNNLKTGTSTRKLSVNVFFEGFWAVKRTSLSTLYFKEGETIFFCISKHCQT